MLVEIEHLVPVLVLVSVVVSLTISFGVVVILLLPFQGLAHLEHGGLVESVETRVRKKVHLSNEVSQVIMSSSTRIVA